MTLDGWCHFINQTKLTIMKSISRILALFMLVSTALTSCKDDKEVVPNYTVAFKYTPEAPIAGQEVTFTNASTGGKEFAWTIDGKSLKGAEVKHTFVKDGAYDVSLQVDGYKELTSKETVQVGDQLPTYTVAAELLEMQTPLEFTADIYNPEAAEVTYKWTFPENSIKGETNVLEGKKVTVEFKKEGEFDFTIEATIGGKTFTVDTDVVIIKQAAKTIYWAEKGGNIFSSKMYTSGVVDAIDTDVNGGEHPLTIQFANDRLYVFDAGQNTGWAATKEEAGREGSIKSYDREGANYKEHATFTDHNYDDAFYGYVDAENIYFTDRYGYVAKLGINDEVGVLEGDALVAAMFVKNNQLAYYSSYNPTGEYSYGWGALNGSFLKQGDTFWWAKASNHRGIYRFVEGDIKIPTAEGASELPAAGAILLDYTVKTFVIDEANSTIYFAANRTAPEGIGFYKCDLEGQNVVLIDASPVDGEGGGNEYVYITGIAVDNASGYVYWAYRGPTKVDDVEVDYAVTPLLQSGIKKFKLNGTVGTDEVEFFAKGVEAYGLAIDHAIQ